MNYSNVLLTFTTAILVVVGEASSCNGDLQIPKNSHDHRFAEVNILREDRLVFANYNAQVKAFDEVHSLHLKRATRSVFSPNFKLTIVTSDENGNNIFIDKTPKREEMLRAERNVFLDPDSLAAVRLHQDGTPTLKMSGVLNGMVIHHENGQHIATRIPDLESRLSDHVDLHRYTSKHRKVDLNGNPSLSSAAQSAPTTPEITTVQPELVIVFDYANYQTFKGNNTAMTNYLSLFMHSVNNRYANLADPKVSFVVTGLIAISSEAGQPFMASAKIAGEDAYDIYIMLDKFAEWTFSQSASLSEHDLASLFTGVHVQSKNIHGKYEDNISGLAFLGAACLIDTESKMDLGTAVIIDARGYYEGVDTATHELAHNLGSPHDGEDDSDSIYSSKDCPSDGGHIMSYAGQGTKLKFYFSSCSATQMKNFLGTPSATCVHSRQSTTSWTENKFNPGDFMNMTIQCQKFTQNPEADVDNSISPSDICKNLICKYPNDTNSQMIRIIKTNQMPADYSACGTSEMGSCVDGECVIQPNMTSQCRSATNDAKATHDKSKTASSLCQNLSCRLSNGTIKSLGKPAIDHCPCGFKGRCIDNKCDQPPIVVPASLNAQCQKATGQAQAYADTTETPDELCSNLTCRYPIDDNSGRSYTVKYDRRPEDYSECDTNKNCDNGKCIVLDA